MILFRDLLSCGHSVNVEVVVPMKLEQRKPQRVGTTSRCWECPPSSGAVALVVIDDVWVQIAPGCYVDEEGTLHLDALEVCEAAGVDPTDENQERLAEVARAEFADRPTAVSVETGPAASRQSLARADCVVAIADLVARTGAAQFTIGYLRDEDEPEFAEKGPGWYAQVQLRGARVICDEMPFPEHAADGLAHRLLDGGTCTHCGEFTTTAPTETGIYLRFGSHRKARCKWRRLGDHWYSGCDPAVAS